jgi:hypothetical protein
VCGGTVIPPHHLEYVLMVVDIIQFLPSSKKKNKQQNFLPKEEIKIAIYIYISHTLISVIFPKSYYF